MNSLLGDHGDSRPSRTDYRIDPKINEQLLSGESRRAVLPKGELQQFPEPPYPEGPWTKHRAMTEKEYNALNRTRNVHGWLLPYLKSRIYARRFRPILSYIFTDWKCNIDCHYCWAFNNKIPGMTEDVGKRSIDWLHSVGCRVAALMGGEPLIRARFIHKLVSYAAKKDFFVYLPTNGRLMNPEVIDRIGDAGVAVWNLAVDAVDDKPGLPKAFSHIRSNLDYLVKMQHHYGYMVFFNINICRNNIEDVKELTEIARSNDIATDYHLNESPMMEQSHFKHVDDNPTFIRPEDFPAIDALLDHLSDKNRSGYKMINSIQHFQDMKGFMRGRVDDWECRAGHNTSLIRTDGTLAPCFSMYSSTYDWGTIENPKFDFGQLDEMKKSCKLHCLSTCQHTTGYAYNLWRVTKWLAKQAKRGFRGVTGSF
jgi:MoaA/NifB/PqqE/SkfB family radical SAM enzyme